MQSQTHIIYLGIISARYRSQRFYIKCNSKNLSIIRYPYKDLRHYPWKIDVKIAINLGFCNPTWLFVYIQIHKMYKVYKNNLINIFYYKIYCCIEMKISLNVKLKTEIVEID